MLTVAVTIYILSFSLISGQILLYNTENDPITEKFDCIYDTHLNGKEIPYCQRLGENFTLIRQRTECENEGKKKLFRDLLDRDIQPNEVLKWSSSVEMVDLYASIYYNRSRIKENDDQFICQCTQLGTFGKYCEYQLIHNKFKFSEAIKAQFHQKEIGDSWNTQRYSDILCYQTLSCDSSPLCLDWREICDGVQRCSNGIDEENCDKLEFNECEDDEYRCMNGMCIAEEFWFDGTRDCMDWTDEYANYGDHCPFTPNTIECDEHLCPVQGYSCGDGQCVGWLSRMPFQRLTKNEADCFSKRNLNYMCEISRDRPTWTLENGLCSPDKDYDDLRYPPWNITNVSNLTDEEKCEYLFRCLASDNFEHDCPCNHLDCKKIMISVCPELIVYPPRGLTNGNNIFFYKSREYERNKEVDGFELGGSLKCPGYLSQVKENVPMVIELKSLGTPYSNQKLCFQSDLYRIQQNFSSRFQIDEFCWNGSLTFNGRSYAVNPDICNTTGQCISQYRILDGAGDCWLRFDEPESLNNSYCTGNVGRQRFQCYNDQHKCLRSEYFGYRSRTSHCLNSYEQSWYGNGLPLQDDIPCNMDLIADCYRVKEYIRQSSNKNTSGNNTLDHYQTNRIPFRSYCDSFWDFDTHGDELPSSCEHWLCESDQYQCQTGQCIKFEWLCDGNWDCADASDEEAMVLIRQWSSHNAGLSNLSAQVENCRAKYSRSPFSNVCNVSFEFGCYRSGVSDPLDITSHRPCINLTQIGDGKEDCYNAYDEKNTFAAKSTMGGMWGFHFRCGNDHKTYMEASCSTEKINCTNIICLRDRDNNQSCSGEKDFICLEDNQCKKNARCNGTPDCSYGEDEYWCAYGTIMDQGAYRFEKFQIFKQQSLDISLIEYPKKSTSMAIEQQVSKSIIHLESDQLFTNYSYICNRGITVLQMNNTRCLCPPPFYGHRCQFFSDRLSVIAHLDRKTLPISMSNTTLKIQTNFLFNDMIIDQHEFHLLPIVETTKIIKHQFYLLYSRSDSMIKHKRNRYFNRTDVVTNHPYAVHFILFALYTNNRPEELGTWHYPIYFDYLPSFRLAIVLKFPYWFGNLSFNHSQPNSCNKYSTCLPIFNQNDSYYCSCKNGYYGTDCSIYEPQCDSHCALNAFCKPKTIDRQSNETKPHCICPLGHFGTHCNLKYEQCGQNACQNNGTCYPSYDQSGEEPFICSCLNRFYGSRCQNEKASVRVQLNMTTAFAARATVVQLYEILRPSLTLQIKHQKVHEGLPSIITSYFADNRAPPLGILKTYENSQDPQYFVMYVLNQSLINISSSPQHCPHISVFLPKDTNRSVPIVFEYHQICRNNTGRFCFHDENYFCLCKSNDFRAECLIHNTQLDHCDKCLSGGKCLQNDPTDPNDFVCLCPSCHQGHRCEFNLEAFGSTFDSLLVRFATVPKIVYLCIVILLFMMGLITNFWSFITFKRPIPRKFGTGTYLLMVSCFNQLALLFLLLKFIQITFGISSIFSCRLVSSLLSVFTRSTYWLTSWVTVDRILIILFPNAVRLKSARLAIWLTIATLVILLGMHIHETIFYTSIQHSPTNFSICVTNMNTGFVSAYNRVSTPIHYILPFLIQTISITLLIVFITRSRVRVTGQSSTFYQALKTQFQNQKELYVTPALVIFSLSPQLIVTFSFACKGLNEGERHMLLCAYLLSYAPQVLGFIMYVLPSTSYRKEFSETIMGKKFFKRMLDKKKVETIVSKTKTVKL